MVITQDQADILMSLLEYATEENWPHVASRITESYPTEEVVRAWKALEEISSYGDMVPDAEDF